MQATPKAQCHRYWLRLGALLTALLGAPMALALDISGMSSEEAGMAISKAAEAHHRGWKSGRWDGVMVLRDATGAESFRPLFTHALEGKNKKDGGRSFIQYDKDGTGLLTYMNRSKPDAQWVWVPSMKARIRVNISNVTGSFIGSEFAMEDLRSQYPEKFKIKLLREEELDGMKVWVLERKPIKKKLKKTGYSKQIAWMEQTEFRGLKTDFYDRKGDLLKTITTHDWNKVNDKHWRSARSEVVNHQTGRSSTLLQKEVELDIGLKAGHFSENSKLLR